MTSSAQNISGAVTYIGSDQPIESVFIYLENTNHETLSTVQGTFKLTDIDKGTYTIHFDLLGYTHYSTQIEVKDQDIEINATLQESSIDLNEILVSSNSITGGQSSYRTLPGSAHYISSKELQKLNTTDPHEILRNLPGVQIQDEDGFGLRPNIGLRGTGTERSSKITVMEDGILAAPAPYAAPSAYYFPTLGRMHAVEVRKGSGQIQYGPYTTGGMLNAISTPIPDHFSGQIKMNAGSFNFRNIHAFIGNQHKNLSYLVEGFQYSSTGFKNLGNQNTGFDKKDYLAKIRYESNANAKVYQSWTGKIGESRERSNETYLGLAPQDFDKDAFGRYSGSQVDEMNTSHRQISLTHLIQPHKSIYISTNIYKNTFKRNWYKLDKVKDDQGEKISISALLNNTDNYINAFDIVKGQTSLLPDALHVKANNRSYTSEGIQTRLNAHISDQHTIELGLRLHRDEMDRYQWVDEYQMLDNTMELTQPGTEGTESNRLETAKAFSGHLLYTYKKGKLEFSPGIRLESVTMTRNDYGKEDPERTGINLSTRSNHDKVWIPGLGIQYSLSSSINIFGGVHKGYAPQGSAQGTKAESSTNYELGLRYESNQLFGSLTTYLNDYHNLLGADLSFSGGQGSGDLFNGGNVLSWGIESQVAYTLMLDESDNFYIPMEINYTLSQAQFNNSFDSTFDAWGEVKKGDQLPYLSQHQLNIHTGININKWQFNLSANYVSSMRISAGQEELSSDNSIDGRWISNLSLRYTITPKTSFSINVQNAFNNEYVVANRPAGYRPGKPRAFIFGLAAAF